MEKIEVSQSEYISKKKRNNKNNNILSLILMIAIAFVIGAGLMYLYNKYNPVVITKDRTISETKVSEVAMEDAIDKVFDSVVCIEVLNNNGQVDRYSRNLNFNNIKLEKLSYNSKDIANNTLFICKGKLFKSEYLMDAVNNGVVAYISETYFEDIPENVAYIVVKDVREAMYLVSNLFYNYAWKNITTVGLTGTKGKTTTTYYLRNILDKHLGRRCGIISTIDTYTGITEEESHLTTPEAPDLHRFFYETAKSNIPVLVMEVASQGYKVKRVNGVTFDIGVFLNISEDHISDAEHPNFQDYLDCKLEFIRNVKTAIINKNTDFYDVVMENAKNAEKVITYGTDDTADYYVSNISKEGNYTVFDIIGKDYKNTFKTSMQGRFNVENALAAFVVAKQIGISDEDIAYGIANTEVKGRMNVFEKDGITVIVDYAHNKLSFTKLYESLVLDYKGRRIVSVGGGPGGKAYARRKDFGEIVGKYSDYVYLTAEDPQFEIVEDICNDIAAYIPHKNYEIVEDRKEAVLKALETAKPGDVIVLLAKGEETYQKVRGVFTPYESDLQLTKDWMER